jgi:hypothetical protein
MKTWTVSYPSILIEFLWNYKGNNDKS